MKKAVKDRISAHKRNGAYMHYCPKCGRLLECELVGAKHYVDCTEHGQEIGVGSVYIPKEVFK